MGMGSRLCGNDGVRQGMVEPQRALRAQRGRDREGWNPTAQARSTTPACVRTTGKCGVERVFANPCTTVSHSVTLSFGPGLHEVTGSYLKVKESDSNVTRCDTGDGGAAEGAERRPRCR